MKTFVKFMIFIEWLKLVKMQKDINEMILNLIKSLAKNHAVL